MSVPQSLALSTTESGMEGAFSTEDSDKFGRKGERRAHKACLLCRQIHKRCDGTRPCQTCVWRGRSQECVDDSKAGSCVVCRKRKVKCDMQRPCSRCMRLKREDACVSTDYGEEQATAKDCAEPAFKQLGLSSLHAKPHETEKAALHNPLALQSPQLQLPLQFPAAGLLPQAAPCLDFPLHFPMTHFPALPQTPLPQHSMSLPLGMQGMLPSLPMPAPPPTVNSNLLGLLFHGANPNLLAQLVTSAGLPSSGLG
mmetsp:Transcript_11823/g.24373  ORF Transcript_11823/g.24373 Transcript_11823/m.24373 type:complete len:254 (-) Transcript_11823:59-820(-)|eukprot:CAMPEP_0196725204 /NCGR_PEP_ID=MMETSP1091-20130531/6829_1 /TAXON_ID=302021 /ORGANISM="Rhodomonas sp., Strain CCMP768" /LENGTH=253 /DNA_ID=CAMNT_0042067445 /DNA_START=70 /DNA_END=831 /DNA_ORIENTATION=-